MTSGYVPLSACIVSEKIWRVLIDASAEAGVFGHGYTYSSHPLAAAVAMTNLDLIEQEGLVAQAASRGAFMHERFRESFADHPLVGEIRGQALIGALEFVAEQSPAKKFDPQGKVSARITRRCLELGVITRALPASDTISFSPPFVISEDELEEMVGTVRRAVDEVTAELRSEGAFP
jgi:L-2,4-diaminobutyrate transaminase